MIKIKKGTTYSGFGIIGAPRAPVANRAASAITNPIPRRKLVLTGIVTLCDPIVAILSTTILFAQY